MPDGDKYKIWLRTHRNGMIANVSETKAGRFIAAAGRSGETCLASNHASLDQAKAAADAEACADGHGCEAQCGSWSK